MTHDILHQHHTRFNNLTITFSDAMYNEALIAIEDLYIVITNFSLTHFGMNSLNRTASDLINTEINRELQYNTAEMAAIVTRNVALMNDEQRTIYDRILLTVSAGQGGFFFLDAPGGTGKTFLISLILDEIRSNNGIALAVASSGIEATLLDGGRTDNLNLKIQQLLPGNLVSYKSIDTGCDTSEAVNFPTEFLNSLDLPGMPPHNLQLKDGTPIIFLRKLNPPRLCNGTRLVIRKLMKNVIEASILNSKFKGENILIPQIPIIPTDVPIQFKRIQFPIRLAFAMTINNSQGQTMSICGLDLSTPCFSHVQLYVACSPSRLFVLAKDGLTKNIVHAIALKD